MTKLAALTLLASTLLVSTSVFAQAPADTDADGETATQVSTYEPARASATTRPSLYFEALGRDGLYGIGFEVPASRQLTLGISGSYLSHNESYYNDSFTLVSPYVTAYTGGERHRGFLTGGLLLDFYSSSYDFSSSDFFSAQVDGATGTYHGLAIIPQVGIGYEYRNPRGFIFRLTAYADYISNSDQKILPWAGITLGSAL